MNVTNQRNWNNLLFIETILNKMKLRFATWLKVSHKLFIIIWHGWKYVKRLNNPRNHLSVG